MASPPYVTFFLALRTRPTKELYFFVGSSAFFTAQSTIGAASHGATTVFGLLFLDPFTFELSAIIYCTNVPISTPIG